MMISPIRNYIHLHPPAALRGAVSAETRTIAVRRVWELISARNVLETYSSSHLHCKHPSSWDSLQRMFIWQEATQKRAMKQTSTNLHLLLKMFYDSQSSNTNFHFDTKFLELLSRDFHPWLCNSVCLEISAILLICILFIFLGKTNAACRRNLRQSKISLLTFCSKFRVYNEVLHFCIYTLNAWLKYVKTTIIIHFLKLLIFSRFWKPFCQK